MFELQHPLVEYPSNPETKDCADLECEEIQLCLCSLCSCCSVCTSKCSCPSAQTDPDQKVAELLGLGDEKYREAQDYYAKNEDSSDSTTDSGDTETEDNDE